MEELERDIEYIKKKSVDWIETNFVGYSHKIKSIQHTPWRETIKESATHVFLYVDTWSEENGSQIYLLFDLNCSNYKMLVSTVIDFKN